MDDIYDILIMGSGMGGLVSAVILAKEGKKVCVLEKNNQYGGNLQTFVRDKTIYDTGVHYIGNLERGQNLHRYFSYLGIMEGLKLEKMDEDGFDWITFDGDTNAYPHAQGYENFIRQLTAYFPNEEDTIKKYCGDIQAICKQFPLYNFSAKTLYSSDVLSIGVKDYFDNLTNNEKLKAVLAGSNVLYAGNGEVTPFYMHALTIDTYIKSAWRCIRGGSQISKLLVKQLRRFGGDIFKRQEITDFIYKDDYITGVKTKKGDTFFAHTFISNMDLPSVVKMGKGHFRKSFSRRVNRLNVTPSSFTLHLKLKPESFLYQNYNIYHIKKEAKIWSSMQYKKEDWPLIYLLSMGTNKPNRKYAESMSILTYMDFEEVKEWENYVNTVVEPNERPQSYEKFKADRTEKIIKELEKKYPNIRECILSTHVSTPLTYRDYIGGKNGNLYGFENDYRNPMKTYFSPKTSIPNLFLTGQYVNMHGIVGVTIGAVNTCAKIVGREYLVNKIKNETEDI